jgi:hypothetical protein
MLGSVAFKLKILVHQVAQTFGHTDFSLAVAILFTKLNTGIELAL